MFEVWLVAGLHWFRIWVWKCLVLLFSSFLVEMQIWELNGFSIGQRFGLSFDGLCVLCSKKHAPFIGQDGDCIVWRFNIFNHILKWNHHMNIEWLEMWWWIRYYLIQSKVEIYHNLVERKETWSWPLDAIGAMWRKRAIWSFCLFSPLMLEVKWFNWSLESLTTWIPSVL